MTFGDDMNVLQIYNLSVDLKQFNLKLIRTRRFSWHFASLVSIISLVTFESFMGGARRKLERGHLNILKRV